MVRTMCIILSMAFLVLGILGITGVVSMFKSNPDYVNIAEIVLGAVGLLAGIFGKM